ncbi:MAG: ATP synthase F0 subunit B [Myxococcales bacterium]|nr:ATP synthase F0 subunit B [Myxococcales bacterium]
MKRIAWSVSLAAALSLGTAAAWAGPEVDVAPAHGAAAPGGHGGGHAKGGDAHGGGHHELAPINWFDISNKKQPPYLALVVNFALLAYLYYRFGKTPVAEGLKKRREQVAKQIEEAARIKSEAEGRAKKYQAQLDRLDEEAAEAREAIRTTGEADKARVLREADEKAARMERDAEQLVDAEMKQAKRALYEECVEAAVHRAEELLRSKLTIDDQERLAEEFIAQLAAQGATPARGAATAAAAPMQKRGEP